MNRPTASTKKLVISNTKSPSLWTKHARKVLSLKEGKSYSRNFRKPGKSWRQTATIGPSWNIFSKASQILLPTKKNS